MRLHLVLMRVGIRAAEAARPREASLPYGEAAIDDEVVAGDVA